jgi:TolB-like protein/DNA-binding winged helix-turn-helix (wHTH) protein/tetratricopeptide (TPR) repeat protein
LPLSVLCRIILGARTQWRLGAGTAQVFHFGDFTLDQSRYRLRRGERILRLERRPMELLFLLVEKRGELVTREEVADRLWGTTVFVDIDQSINTAIRKIRIALHDDPNKPRFIETVIGKGYRFTAAATCNGDFRVVVPPEQASPLPSPQGAPSPAVSPADERAGHPKTRRLLIAVFLLMLVAAGWWLSRSHVPRSTAQPRIQSLAVLPLKNLSGNPAQEYLADGMTEALIGRLSAIHDLRVISRTSVMRFKDTRLSLPEIAKILQVDAFVEGSVMLQDNRIRVIAQLIRGATDDHFWSETYDRNLQDVLALQSDVAQAIARRVEVTITGREHERIVATHHVLPEVYESFLKGRFILHSKANTRAGVEESIQYFQATIEKDLTFAQGYVGLAAARSQLGLVRNGGGLENRQQIVEAARRALELDRNLSEAHVLLADTAQKQWNWAEAEAEYRKALDVNPSDADAYSGLGSLLMCEGRMDEAVNWAERGRELDRLGSSGDALAWILFNARRYDDAIRELRSILAVRPDDVQPLWTLGFALILKGQARDAIPPLEKAAALSARSSGVIDLLSAAYARAGRHDDALRIVAELKRRRQEGYVQATSFVIAYVGLGDREQAFASLEEAYKEKSNILQFVKVHPFLDPLRSDPRFADLLHRVGLG